MANQSGKTPESHLAAKNAADGSNRSMITDLQILLRDCLLPTPTSTDAKSPARFAPDGQPHSAKNGLGLTDWARATTELLPAPAASDATGGRTGKHMGKRPSGQKAQETLGMVVNFLPTPTASDGKGPSPASAARNGASRLRDVATYLPTPMARDGDYRGCGQGRVERRWKERKTMMLDDAVRLSSPECQTAPNEITGLLLENMSLF